jgi:DNA-binding transcriptional MocR family regulator
LHAIASVRGLEAGLHAFVEFEAQVQIEKLVQKCLHQGILLTDLTRYYSAEPGQRGVVLGYGGLELHEIEWAGRQIVSHVQTDSHW